MKYLPVIGIEIHVELNTKSKMFCSCSADYFGAEPNSHTCPVCLGLPGALPVINQEAIDKCMQIGLALGCCIVNESRFERKNYFYPDLPKGYQISQYRWPLCVDGIIEVGEKSIRINRVHQEEDTGKLMHQGPETVIDYNRSSVPLVEIVTEPDFSTPDQVVDYAKKLQQIFRYLKVSEADMEKGQMRLEANVSVRPEGQIELPNYRVELKNINSFSYMKEAILYEIKRQSEALENGEALTQETRGWNETKKQTFLQRSKEEAHDYRYFPEPDLPELKIDEGRINNIESGMPELPETKIKRFQKEYGLSTQYAQILATSIEFASLYEQAVEYGNDRGVEPKEIANFIINQKLDIFNTDYRQIVDDIKAKKADILEDQSELEAFAKKAIEENPEIVDRYKSGKVAVIGVLVGSVMQKSKGKANAAKVKEILERLLQ